MLFKTLSINDSYCNTAPEKLIGLEELKLLNTKKEITNLVSSRKQRGGCSAFLESIKILVDDIKIDW